MHRWEKSGYRESQEIAIEATGCNKSESVDNVAKQEKTIKRPSREIKNSAAIAKNKNLSTRGTKEKRDA